MDKDGKSRLPRCLRSAVIFAVLITAGIPAVHPINVSVSGGYGFVIDQADLTGGAGSGFAPTHESTDNAMIIDVGDTTGGTDAWQIEVHKEDSLWPAGLLLSLLRTGSGTGAVNGGDVLPVELTATDQVFFDGAGDNTGITVKMILDGVSVLFPADNYSTTVYVTVIDVP